MVKRMRHFSKFDEASNCHIMGNKFYSIKMNSLRFPLDQLYNLKYEFYLESAIGKIEEGEI